MPPIRPQKSQRLVQQEGPLLLAIKAIKDGRYASVAAAARAFNVPVSTLKHRIKGRQFWNESRPSGHKFTALEEKSMENWLLSMDSRGAALTHAMLRDMANLLLQSRELTHSDPAPKVGKNWTTEFVKRHETLSSRLSRKYNYERALSEDPRVIGSWFHLVETTIQKYGITSDDIYNFDESGFAMGINSTQRVITSAEYHGRRGVLQPGNREWVTVIECIGASGVALPPYLIFKEKVFLERWLSKPPLWSVNKSSNGWTSNEIGIDWLRKHLLSYLRKRKGKYVLLILDGHSSHLTPAFDKICEENDIISLCMPAHASHLLQPLDVGCFSVLKRVYGALVMEEMRLGVNSIDKDDFIQLYPIAREAAFKAQTIYNSFRGTGLVPLDATSVLNKLNIQLDSLPPSIPLEPRPASSSSTSDLDTLWSLSKLQKMNSQIKKGLEPSSETMTSPLKRAIDRSHNMAVRLTHELIFIQDRCTRLETANKKQVKKRASGGKQISHKGSLRNLEEIRADLVVKKNGRRRYISMADGAAESPAEPGLPPVRTIRRHVTCSGCGTKGHTYSQCPHKVI